MSITKKILIHTALYPEAKPIIQYFNLIQNKSYEPLKIFENNKYILVVSGMGRKKTNDVLSYMFEQFSIKKIINIGIAGCKDTSIKLGTLFCINHIMENINTTTITTVDRPLTDDVELKTVLVDMEADMFLEVSKTYLDEENIFVFKIVSDYLSDKIPDKSFVYNSIKKSIPKWENVI